MVFETSYCRYLGFVAAAVLMSVLVPTALAQQPASGSKAVDKPADNTQGMEFADKPDFAVAGVTDWTAVGGHGSDSSLRTSEALTREALTLKAEGSGEGKLENGSESRLRADLAGAPGSFAANHQLGAFYLHSGRYRESIPLLQAAYKIDPANHGNEYDLALALQQAGDFPQAREHVQKLLALQDNADWRRSWVSSTREWAILWPQSTRMSRQSAWTRANRITSPGAQSYCFTGPSGKP